MSNPRNLLLASLKSKQTYWLTDQTTSHTTAYTSYWSTAVSTSNSTVGNIYAESTVFDGYYYAYYVSEPTYRTTSALNGYEIVPSTCAEWCKSAVNMGAGYVNGVDGGSWTCVAYTSACLYATVPSYIDYETYMGSVPVRVEDPNYRTIGYYYVGNYTTVYNSYWSTSAYVSRTTTYQTYWTTERETDE